MSDALVSTPAFRQALYIQQLAQAPISRTASVELAARILSRFTGRTQSGRPTVQSALLEEKTQRQQAKCTAIKSLLQLSPLLAEEEPMGQAAADVLINYCLLPGDDAMPRSSKDLDEEERELRQLCLLALVALSPQPQSVTSLFTLSPQLQGGSTAAVHGSQLPSTSGHALLSWVDNVMLTDWQLKKVHIEASVLTLSTSVTPQHGGRSSLCEQLSCHDKARPSLGMLILHATLRCNDISTMLADVCTVDVASGLAGPSAHRDLSAAHDRLRQDGAASRAGSRGAHKH